MAGDIYEQHLREVVNRTWNFAGRLVTPQDHEQNALTGLATEAAEVLDTAKKRWWHNPKPDGRRDELRDELGDLEFYRVKAYEIFGFTPEEVLAVNKTKLMARHRDKFR